LKNRWPHALGFAVFIPNRCEGTRMAAPLFPSIPKLASMIAENPAAAMDMAHRTIDAIAACADKAIFTCVTKERAFDEAAVTSQRIAQGLPFRLLEGVPVAWKDLFDLTGDVTRAGSLVLDDGQASADAELVQRLAAAGAVTIGKVNMTEFAFSGLGLNPHYGTPRNPWSGAQARIPGGSSSGSAVAVALGLVPVAIGTDTSGSVRIPAALNGIVGFKTSGNRWPLSGAFPLSPTLDTAGVMTNTVTDAAIVDAAARGLPVVDLKPASLEGLRIIVPMNAVWDGVELAIVRNFEQTLDRLTDLGVSVERRRLNLLDEVLALGARHGTIVAIEAFRTHRRILSTASSERLDTRVRARLESGGLISPAAERTIRETRVDLMNAVSLLFDENTFLACPTVPLVAPLTAPLAADDDLFVRINGLMLRNTMIGSFLDLCGISIPNGSGDFGLPTGFLLCGGPRLDSELLAAAMTMEPAIRGSFAGKCSVFQ
jgi:aspartyl-tRNA(Asn)/glutamyl-tRNA(Gln) amidotransferase subunit A